MSSLGSFSTLELEGIARLRAMEAGFELMVVGLFCCPAFSDSLPLFQLTRIESHNVMLSVM